MSRIGKNAITIPAGVTVTINDKLVTVKGPKGELSQEIRPEIKAELVNNQVVFSVIHKSKQTPGFWGLSRALVANMIKGVTEGFEKKLELVGVGYRVKKAANGITITVGFSHPIEFTAPNGIDFDVADEKSLVVKGIDKQLVGLTAAQVRAFRKPEPYKGKGIKYADEVVRRKAGKTGKV